MLPIVHRKKKRTVTANPDRRKDPVICKKYSKSAATSSIGGGEDAAWKQSPESATLSRKRSANDSHGVEGGSIAGGEQKLRECHKHISQNSLTSLLLTNPSNPSRSKDSKIGILASKTQTSQVHERR